MINIFTLLFLGVAQDNSAYTDGFLIKASKKFWPTFFGCLYQKKDKLRTVLPRSLGVEGLSVVLLTLLLFLYKPDAPTASDFVVDQSVV